MQACRWSWLRRHKAEQVRAVRIVRAITGTGADSPGGLTLAPELWAEWGGPRAKNTGRADSVSGTQQAQRAKSWTTACPGCQLARPETL